ncbi:helix-turn-helix domain-containing protein [Bradyrhizobium yuanmingense]|uniref:helix-turn-helix transcriptional regulator n=1 Tax=Bradyrhizobium yuanmingense TaxID=108015 RepID=UPI0012FBECD2|nr:helix-turn-helix domain-containing protein [Bradyrhizobium yuanmingense]MVT55303.1 helix-turn-helix domain-containing protein [Bradyrhizobium yuanmingense]
MTIDTAKERLHWLTRKEAAAYLRLGESTLAKLFVSGDGPPAIKVGRAIRYASEDLDAWMGSRRRRSTSDIGSLA